MSMIEDISSLTNIPKPTLSKLNNVLVTNIAHEVFDKVHQCDNYCVSDIGIGEITIEWDNNELTYKFTPSSALEKNLLEVINKDIDPLTQLVESNIEQKISKHFKDLFYE